jgi:hypothetical protein
MAYGSFKSEDYTQDVFTVSHLMLCTPCALKFLSKLNIAIFKNKTNHMAQI